MIFGALVAIIGASDLILGPLPKVLGTFHIIPGVHVIILTANRFILGAFAIRYTIYYGHCLVTVVFIYSSGLWLGTFWAVLHQVLPQRFGSYSIIFGAFAEPLYLVI